MAGGGNMTALAALSLSIDGNAAEPFWKFYVQNVADVAPSLLAEPLAAESLRAARRILVAPGDWWQDIDLARYHLPVRPSLLALPMDGHGHQMERLALLLACELAVWERAARATQTTESGIMTFAAPIPASKVMLIDPKSGEPSRIRRQKDADGTIERIGTRSGVAIPRVR